MNLYSDDTEQYRGLVLAEPAQPRNVRTSDFFDGRLRRDVVEQVMLVWRKGPLTNPDVKKLLEKYPLIK